MKSPFLIAVICGLSLALSSRHPDTILSVLSGWGFAALLVYQAKAFGLRYFPMFVLGLAFHFSSMPWLVETLTIFGGFGTGLSAVLFIVFSCVSSLQFLLLAFFYRKIYPAFGLVALFPAWLISNFLTPKLFPWELFYSQLGFTPLAMNAAFFGASFLSGVMILLCALALQRRYIMFSSLFVILLASGFVSTELTRNALKDAPELKVALVQGNIGLTEKSSREKFVENVEKYKSITSRAFANGSEFVVWPESVLNSFFPISYLERFELMDSQPGDLLLGILTSYRDKRYNSALGLNPGGVFAGLYHKKILMPFGEYLPLESTFPSIRNFSPNSGSFDAGASSAPVNFKSGIRAGVLICYEDMLPGLARESVNKGANVLVNITNDAWYGVSAAPYQHHLLAAFRAIETRRFLLRATNTGYSAIVSPHGELLADSGLFEEKLIESTIRLNNSRTGGIDAGGVLTALVLLLVAVQVLVKRYGA